MKLVELMKYKRYPWSNVFFGLTSYLTITKEQENILLTKNQKDSYPAKRASEMICKQKNIKQFILSVTKLKVGGIFQQEWSHFSCNILFIGENHKIRQENQKGMQE